MKRKKREQEIADLIEVVGCGTSQSQKVKDAAAKIGCGERTLWRYLRCAPRRETLVLRALRGLVNS